MAWLAVFVLAVVIVAFGVVAQAVSLYNGLVQVKQQVDQAWSNIDVLLKQRHDELPKLIDAVKAYMTHESGLLEKVTDLRTRAQASDLGAPRLTAEEALSQGVSQLLAVAESYPQLRASEVFMDLQKRISALEEQIAHRREFYNAAVNINNVRMEEFPDRLLTPFAGLVVRPLFESKEAEREDIDVAARLRLRSGS